MTSPADRSELVDQANHELRTPLAVIAGYTELLLDEADLTLTPQQREWLEKMASNCGRLEQAIEALVGRLAAGD